MQFKPKENKILTSLKNGETPLGLEISIAKPEIIEVMAFTGFDFYMLDMEHTRLNPETMENCIRAADAAGITTLVRVPENRSSDISHAVEAGAQGIVIPHVKSKLDIERASDALRYAPKGSMGACPGIRRAQYSMDFWDEFVEHHNETTMVIPLIEDMEAVDNIEEIVSGLIPGLDALGMGVGDLSQSIAKPGEKARWDHPEILRAKKKVTDACKKSGIALLNDPMINPSIENAKKQIEEGAEICMYEMDLTLFYNLCKEIANGIKN